MERLCDLINQGYLDIFSIFALGMRRNSTAILQYLLFFINAFVPSLIVAVYVFKGNLMISIDALSRATDIMDLLFPILVHIFVLLNYICSQKMFDEISAMAEYFDKVFKSFNPEHFKKTLKSSTINYTIKFLVINGLGVGIDSFMLIT